MVVTSGGWFGKNEKKREIELLLFNIMEIYKKMASHSICFLFVCLVSRGEMR